MYGIEKWGGGKLMSGLQGGVNSSSKSSDGGGSAVEARCRGSMHFFSTASVVVLKFSTSFESNYFVLIEENVSLILLGS